MPDARADAFLFELQTADRTTVQRRLSCRHERATSQPSICRGPRGPRRPISWRAPTQIKLATTGEIADMSGFAGRASSIHVSEAFRIENNQIRRVEMIGTGVLYHLNSTWGPFLSGK